MTYYFIYLGLAIIFLIYRLIINILNVRSTSSILPSELSDIYKPEEYKKFLAYSKEKGRFDIVSTIFSAFIEIALFLTPLFAIISNGVANPYLSSLIILAVYIGIGGICSIPFEYHSSIKIEDKYGFNKCTLKTFIGDQIRGFIISFLLFYVIIVLYISLYQSLKLYSIIVIGVCLILLLLLINFFAPMLVSMSNKKVPLQQGELREKLVNLLDSEGYKVKEIYVIDGSKRSSKANAFFTGFGKEKSIMLYDTLVDLMTPEEITAVFAHELGHGKHKDVLKNFILNSLFMCILVAGLVLITEFVPIYKDFWLKDINFGWMIMILSSSILPIITTLYGILSSYLSRKYEYAADHLAKEKGYGEFLISALKKLTVNNFSNLTPNKFVVKMSYSHPPVGDRIKALK